MGLFSNSKTDLVLSVILEEGDLSPSSIARKLGVSKSLVSMVLSDLKKSGILKRGKLDKRKAEIAMRVLLLRKVLELDFSKIGKKFDLKGIGIFGSYARGSFNEESDIDVWVYLNRKLSQMELAKLRKELERKFGREVDLVVIDGKKFEEMKRRKSPLFYEILNSIVLWGDLD